GAMDLGQQLPTDFIPRPAVPPVEQVPNAGRLAQYPVRLMTGQGKRFLDLADNVQLLPLPQGKRNRTGGLDRGSLEVLQWRRFRGHALYQSLVIALQGSFQSFQGFVRQDQSKAVPPAISPSFHSFFSTLCRRDPKAPSLFRSVL